MARWSQSFEERFWSRVSKSSPDECWIWTGQVVSTTGYGTIWFNPKADKIGAHVASWIIHHKEDPNGCVLHRCDVRRCVNPDHLFVGTRGDHQSKLTASQVEAIRQASGTQQCIANQFGISRTQVSRIRSGSRWRS